VSLEPPPSMLASDDVDVKKTKGGGQTERAERIAKGNTWPPLDEDTYYPPATFDVHMHPATRSIHATPRALPTAVSSVPHAHVADLQHLLTTGTGSPTAAPPAPPLVGYVRWSRSN
jgi:hypothetical protein